jgi:hypothetical protein
MPQLIFEIPTDNAMQRIVDALCADAGWSPNLDPPITKAKFAKKVAADMIKDRVQAVETRLAREAAAAAAVQPGAIDVT